MNGQAVSPVEANSSPSHVSTTLGSSVMLYWTYTYSGNGKHGIVIITYKEQIIGFFTTLQPTIQILARRTGQNGALTLESPVPAPFNGRVKVISSNSTLVIDDLQYNDTIYKFLSYVSVVYVFGDKTVKVDHQLKPMVSITVNGMSTFCISFFFDSI